MTTRVAPWVISTDSADDVAAEVFAVEVPGERFVLPDRRSVTSRSRSATRPVVLDAIDADAVQFYESWFVAEPEHAYRLYDT
jgi:hypothetical protein